MDEILYRLVQRNEKLSGFINGKHPIEDEPISSLEIAMPVRIEYTNYLGRDLMVLDRRANRRTLYRALPGGRGAVKNGVN